MEHITVFRERGRYAGWPANYGIWSWGDEIVVGFTLGYHDTSGGFHSRDRSRPFVGMQARSLDGGLSWDVHEAPFRSPGNRGVSADEHMKPGLGVGRPLESFGMLGSPGGFDFIHPDFALMCARSDLGAGATSWFYVSKDRCKTWDGPFRLPTFGQPGIAARTDYIIDGRDVCTLFLTATKSNGDEGHVFCARTSDGGGTFDFLSWIGPEPEGFSIMPASVKLSDRILVAVRCREEGKNWIDLYSSDDEGSTWNFMNRPVDNTGIGGNPPTLHRLSDGRLCLVYGFRDAPYGMRATLSQDDGVSWGREIILRDDGGNHDLGYPRTVIRPDDTIVTVYYYNDRPDGERYIAATLWDPDEVG